MLQFKKLLLLIILTVFSWSSIFAQSPEQDCFGALPVCETIFQQNNSYTGSGATQELLALYAIDPAFCLINGENNSVWYIFTISAAGDLEFAITPISATDDYDFALFNLTNYTCSEITTGVAPYVRCNYALTSGQPTGLAAGNVAVTASPNGSAFLAPLPVQVGETYALMIDNFTRNGQGYSIDFSNGTAGTADTVSPFLASIDTLTCDTTTTLTLTFSEPVLCDSILSNGSQFQIIGPQTVSVIGAFSASCAAGQKFTQEVTITLANPIITTGNYEVSAVPGTGGLNITDICGRPITSDSVILFAPAIIFPHFTYNIAASCYVDTLNFINISLPNPSNGAPVVWDWNFGDGTPNSSLQDPPHVFADTLLYNVTLTATTVDGCTYSNDSIIPVDRSYRADFSFAPSVICPGVPVQFVDVSPGSADTWLWDFGDGNISGSQNPVNVYSTPGNYAVTLVISETSVAGICTDTRTQDILVLPDVTAAFTLSAQQICQGTPVVFTDQTTGFPSAWRWDFGNGDTSVIQNPTYTYDSVGQFNISLEVTNTCNVDVATQSFDVFEIPVFELGTDTSICFDKSVTLIAFPGATSTTWSTGQSGDSIEVFGAPIEVRASVNNNGCTFDDAIFIDELQEGCIIVPVPSAFTPNGDGFNDLWRLVNPQRLISIEVWIFNRWGQQVFYDNSLDFAWDGSLKGEKAEMGVYSYVLKGFGESSRGREPVLYKGNLTLIR
jgi:gliding motility-associated-like protein